MSGDDHDVILDLCTQLHDCYGEDLYDCASMRDVFTRATSEESQAFLDGYVVQDCLHSCATSRACLDTPLYCARGGSACARDDQCCGWSLGLTSCEADGEGEPRCCATRGASCEVTAECCDAECRNGYCGGFQCKEEKAPCSAAYQCCSKRCFDGQCAVSNCALIDEDCVVDSDCCKLPDSPEVPKCVDGVCALVVETCAAEGEACELGATDPSAAGCCPGEGECVLSLALGHGVCSTNGGCGVGFECASDYDCCGSVCRLELAQPVCEDLACGPAGSACAVGSACCSGLCDPVAGTCLQGQGVACAALEPDCHSLCEVGGLLRPACFADELQQDCVDLVNQTDFFCWCSSWDSVCVSEAASLCLGVCPNGL
ncbi:MAG: hypothetical protein U0271_44650 [Polyangiaceae bacterium]